MMRPAFTIRMVRDDGAELRLDGGDSGWCVETDASDDFSPITNSITTSANVLTDGSSLVSRRLDEVDRTAKAFYFGDKTDRQARSEAQSFFNPKHSFKAYVTYLGQTRWCEGELKAFACNDFDGDLFVGITFTLLCLDPYWRDEFPNDKSFGSAEPRFGFPFVSHVREKLPDGAKRPVGFVVSEMLFDGVGNVYNSGDVPTFYRVRMRFSGDVKNPKIAKDGRYVRMVKDFKAGDELVIDFEASPPRVTVNGENAIQLADRSSSFTKMAMAVGKNEFRFSCDNPENRSLAKVTVDHYKKYLGV